MMAAVVSTAGLAMAGTGQVSMVDDGPMVRAARWTGGPASALALAGPLTGDRYWALVKLRY